MTVETLSLIQMAAPWVILVLIGAALIVLSKKKSVKRIARRITGICVILLAVLGIAFHSGSSALINMARHHGMYDRSHTIGDVIRFIQKSPAEDTLPDDLTDTLVIYYRFDCTDCHDVYEDLKKEITRFEEKTGDKIYWVSTRSEQGERLRETYSVSSVPSLMYIRGSDAAMPYYLEAVHFRESGGAKFYAEAWDKIIKIRDQYTTKAKFAG